MITGTSSGLIENYCYVLPVAADTMISSSYCATKDSSYISKGPVSFRQILKANDRVYSVTKKHSTDSTKIYNSKNALFSKVYPVVSDKAKQNKHIVENKCRVYPLDEKVDLAGEFYQQNIVSKLNVERRALPIICGQEDDYIGTAIFENGRVKFKFLSESEISELNEQALKSQNELLSLQNDLVDLCRDLENCNKVLNRDVLKLQSDWHQILVHMLKNNEDVANDKELVEAAVAYEDSLKSELRKCQGEQIQSTLELDAIVDVKVGDMDDLPDDMSDSFSSWFIGGSIPFYNSDEDIYGKIKESIIEESQKVATVTAKLSKEEIDKVADKIAKEVIADGSNLKNKFNIEKRSNLLFAQRVAQKVLEENDIQTSDAIKFAKKESKSLDKCLKKAFTRRQVSNCMDKFNHTIGYRLGNHILNQLINDNFAEQFSGDDNQVIMDKLKVEARAAYNACASKWFFEGKPKTPDMISVCTYEGVLAAMDITIDNQLEESLGDQVNGDKLQILIKDIKNSYNCPYRDLINNTERWTTTDYGHLTTVTATEFKNVIDECVINLKKHAGEKGIKKIVGNHPALVESIGEKDSMLFAQEVVDKQYKKCQILQKGKGFEPGVCKPLVTVATASAIITKSMETSLSEMIEEIAPKDPKTTQSQISKEVQTSFQECKVKLEKEIKEGIKKSEEATDWEKRLVGCASDSIGRFAAAMAPLTLESEFDNNPSLLAVKVKVDMVKLKAELAQKTQACFKEKINLINEISQLGEDIDGIIDECKLHAKKEVLPSILNTAITENIKEYIPDEKQRASIVEDLLNGGSSLSWIDKLNAAKDAESLEITLNLLEGDVTWNIYSKVVHKNLDELFPAGEGFDELRSTLGKKYLNDDISQKIKTMSKDDREAYVNDLKKQLVEDFALNKLHSTLEEQKISKSKKNEIYKKLQDRLKQCLADETKSSDLCQEDFKREASYEVSSAVMSQVIEDNYKSNDKDSLLNSIKRELRSCVDTKTKLSVDEVTNACITLQSLTLASVVGTDNIVNLGDLIGSKQTQRDYADTKVLQRSSNDPGTKVYQEYQKCLRKIRKDLVGDEDLGARTSKEVIASYARSNQEIDIVSEKIEACTNQLEKTMMFYAREAYLGYDLKERTDKHNEALEKSVDILFLMRSDSDEVEEQSEEEEEDLAELMRYMAQQTVDSCNFDFIRCHDVLDRSLAHIKAYKKGNPKATTQELKNELFESPYMELVIDNTVATTVKDQLETGLMDYMDKDGILKASIASFTSKEVIGEALQTEKGMILKRYVVDKLKKGQKDELEDDPLLKHLAIEFLVEDTRLPDYLMKGLVQPKLNEELAKPSFKTKVGNFFGIVNYSDFDWEKIKTTKSGQQARLLFTSNLLLPSMRDDKIPDKKMEKYVKNLEDLIVEGLKELADSRHDEIEHDISGEYF
jgi:DNA-binding Lrp family transcriptional regulator